MQQSSAYWKAQDGHIISEDRLISGVISGLYAGKVVVLDDYNSRGGIVLFRHPGMKMIRHDAWTEWVILAINRGELARTSLSELFCQYPCICLPDLDLLE